jgi:hypothetical protein
VRESATVTFSDIPLTFFFNLSSSIRLFFFFFFFLDPMIGMSSEPAFEATLLTTEPMMDYASTPTPTMNPIAIHSSMAPASAITAPVVPSMSSAMMQSGVTGAYEYSMQSSTSMMYNSLSQHAAMVNPAQMAAAVAAAAAAAAVQPPMYTPVIASDNHSFSNHLPHVAGQQHQQAEAVLASSSHLLMNPLSSIQEPDIIHAQTTLNESANVLQRQQQVLQDCVQAAANNAVPDQYVTSCLAEHQQQLNHTMVANNTLMSLLDRRRSHHEIMVMSPSPLIHRKKKDREIPIYLFYFILLIMSLFNSVFFKIASAR